MIDDVDHLLISHPATCMKAQRHGSLLGYRRIDCRFEISDSDRALAPMQGLTRVIVRVNERHFPDQVTNHEWIRVIFHVIDEPVHQIL